MQALDGDALDAVQSERLVAMVRHVWDHAPFWREQLERAGVSPVDVRDRWGVTRLPFTTKSELQAEQSDHPPFGRYVCTPPTEWYGHFSTSGTTGRPLQRLFSKRDWELITRATAPRQAVRAGDVVMQMSPTDGLLGPSLTVAGVRLLGGLPVLAGGWSTEKRLQMMQLLCPTVIAGAPSYLLRFAEAAADQGLDLASSGVRALLLAGEPGGAVGGTRERLLASYGGALLKDGYGLTEVMPLGSNCPFSPDLHIREHLVLVECIDPATDRPVAPGELGELVVTNLVCDTHPVLRYRTGDLVRLTTRDACACGHRHVRAANSVQGRADDMIWYRGVNFFPTAVESALRSVPGIGMDYQIVVDERRTLPDLLVRAEAATGVGEDTFARLRETCEALLATRLGIRVPVEVVGSGDLPRAAGSSKTKRLIRLR